MGTLTVTFIAPHYLLRIYPTLSYRKYAFYKSLYPRQTFKRWTIIDGCPVLEK